MNKVVKIVLIIIIIDVIVFGGYFLYKALSGKKKDAAEETYEWVTIDEYYTPVDFVEAYIKNESMQQGLLPVSIKNYGENKAILKKFKGRKFAGPSESVLKAMFKDMEEYKLVTLKYKDQNDRENQRTVLYVYIAGDWRVGDSGKLD
jgi:hypothetical protein